MTSKELVQLCTQWSKDRNIIEGTTAIDQFTKLMEEVGELATSVNKNIAIIDDIGDCLVCLNNVSVQVLGKNIDLKKPIKGNACDNKILLLKFEIAKGKLAQSLLWYEELDENGKMIYNKLNLSHLDSCIKACVRTLNALSYNNGLLLHECLEHAYNDIKDRKGKIVNGVFDKNA